MAYREDDPEAEAEAVTRRLAEMDERGFGGEEADRLRDRGEELWWRLTPEARERLCRLSERLNRHIYRG